MDFWQYKQECWYDDRNLKQQKSEKGGAPLKKRSLSPVELFFLSEREGRDLGVSYRSMHDLSNEGVREYREYQREKALELYRKYKHQFGKFEI